MNNFLNFAELRQLAKRRLPRGIFEYIDRGTEDENALQRNRHGLDAVRIQPRVLAGVAPRSQAISLFGEAHNAPTIVAPTAFAGLVWYRGEIELARAAAANGIPSHIAAPYSPNIRPCDTSPVLAGKICVDSGMCGKAT